MSCVVDPVVDPLVRIEAARLRDKLREYYEADGLKRPHPHRVAEGQLHAARRVRSRQHLSVGRIDKAR